MPTKILVADDSVTMRRVLEMTFAGEDARVIAVDSAEAALTKAAELSPDVVFADVSLPGVDGYDLCKRLKSGASTSKVAVIVLASQHHPYDDAKGRAAGVDDHMSKPFDTQAMIERLGQVLARPRALPAGGVAEAPKPASAAVPPAAARVPAPVTAPAAAPSSSSHSTRMGLGVPSAPASLPAAPVAPAAAKAAQPAATEATPPAPSTPKVDHAATRGLDALAGKLSGLGLSADQLAGVLALSREVIEQVVWEVVPDLAETLIKEELRRLTAD